MTVYSYIIKFLLTLEIFCMSQVKKVLAVLIQHGIVSFELNKKGFVEYTASSHPVVLRGRYPRYVYTTKLLYGDEAELIVEELLHHGQQCMSETVSRVTERLQQTPNTGTVLRHIQQKPNVAFNF